MSQEARIRVSGSSLSQHIGKSVTVLGEFLQLDPNGRVFTMKTSANGSDVVTVQLQEPVQTLLEGYIEVQGTASHNNTVQCQRMVNFPMTFTQKFDLQLYNEVIALAAIKPAHYITTA